MWTWRWIRRALLVGVVFMVPAPAHGWGFEAHRFIVDRAIDLLPGPLRPLFDRHRSMVVERSIDPDTWRAVGFETESPHHFLNLDWDGYGPYPFRGLPRDRAAAEAKFGIDRIRENGTLPWRAEEFFGHVRRSFDNSERRGARGRFDVLLFSAALAHYVSDAHVPFHAVQNYDGQLTNQHGIHARFESTLFERYRELLTIMPPTVRVVVSPRDLVFDSILSGTRMVEPILRADLEAKHGRGTYDDVYYDRFFATVRPQLEQRLNESIAAVAGAIAGAWEAAGRPVVPVESATRPRDRRR